MVSLEGASGLGGLGGFLSGGVFGVLPWVDSSKPAGHTSMRSVLNFRKFLRDCCTLQHFFFQSHSVWFLFSLAIYISFPYDLEAARSGWAAKWVLKRMALIWTMAFSFYSFTWWALYMQSFSVRKFKPDAYPTAGNLLHNVWYFSLGVLQWSLWECAMTWLYATGRVPYVPDEEVLRSPSHMLFTILMILALPVWRDLHFFFMHRMAHIRAVYKYMHSFHHRNTDTEPFSGLTGHPFEHALFFSVSLTPVLYLRCSPFIFAFLFLHVVLPSALIHSGFEDHWNADQFHYIHHRTFESNYGAPLSAWIDIASGTFREKLGTSTEYKGEYNGEYDMEEKDSQKRIFSTQSYLGWQSVDQAMHTLFCLVATATLFASVMRTGVGLPPIMPACVVGAMIAYGPIVVAVLLGAVYDRMPWRWPFHKEHILGVFGLFTLVAWAWCLVPIYHFVTLLCTP